MRLITLKKRSEFLRLRGGARWANAAFIVETKPRFPERRSSSGETAPEPSVELAPELASAVGSGKTTADDLATSRFGFTVTKRIGNAVTRNRIRRRLKEAVRSLAAKHAKPGQDYVVIAKSGIVACGYEQLTRDLKRALERVNKGPESRSGSHDGGRPKHRRKKPPKPNS